MILVECLKGLMDGLNSKKMISNYFFIRYKDEKGPHIRLRILPQKETFQNKIEKNIEKRYHVYIGQKKNITRGELLCRHSEYIPETERYGGEKFLKICEKYFCFSSEVALLFLDKSKKAEYDERFSQALISNLIFIYHFYQNTNKQNIQLFLTKTIQSWINSSITFTKKVSDSSTIYVNKNTLFKQFKDILDKQKNETFSILSKTWSMCELNSFNDFPDLKKWNEQNLQFFNNARKNLDFNPKEVPFNLRPFEGLIHMTNNRLGIGNYDESFICYILLDFINSTDTIGKVKVLYGL